jgi:hypothetical protein
MGKVGYQVAIVVVVLLLGNVLLEIGVSKSLAMGSSTVEPLVRIREELSSKYELMRLMSPFTDAA